MRVALITTDNREHLKKYELDAPWLSPPIAALLEGFQSVENSAAIQVHVLSCTQQLMRSPEKLSENVFFHSLLVPKTGWMRTGYQGCIRAVRKKLKEIQPDIVHGQGTERDCAISAAFSGYPNVVTLHGIMREMARVTRARPGSFLWLSNLIEGVALRRAGGVICISNYTRKMVGARCRKTWLVPNALQTPYFTTPLSTARPAECTILNLGTICSYKRQNELLDVLESLHREGLKFKAQFLGSASRDNAYGTTFLDRVNNSPYLTYLGFKSVDELIRHLDDASALVHVSAIETFGLVVAEALSRNLKFIGFNSGGVADIIRDVDMAEGFEDQDWTGVKSALAKWIHSGFPRPQSAATVMRERYHPLMVARQHLDVYQDLLRRS
jgi:glycosyltransferase involved in cell wall biosynthesis